MPKNVGVVRHTAITRNHTERLDRAMRRPQAASVDLGYSEFDVQGISQNLWPDGLVSFRGNVSLNPQTEMWASHTVISAAPSGGSKVIDVDDVFGAVYGLLEFAVYALTDSTTTTTLRSSTLEVWRGINTVGSVGASGSVPFDDVPIVDGTYFTTQDNGDGTYSPVIHKAGLYVIRLWVSPN